MGATIYLKSPELPSFDLYSKGAHFHTGRVHARVVAPTVIDLVARGVVDPSPSRKAKPSRFRTPRVSWRPANRSSSDDQHSITDTKPSAVQARAAPATVDIETGPARRVNRPKAERVGTIGDRGGPISKAQSGLAPMWTSRSA